MSEHLDIIKKEFTKQSKMFDTYQSAHSKERFNRVAIEKLHLTGYESVLEVAAGTCSLGRMIAPDVKNITELDATEAMLEAGKAENQKAAITNAGYVIGEAEAMPFSDGSFDIVVSRLAFHHFEDVEKAFSEMTRVLRPGGRLLVADMLAREGSDREKAEHYERLRDPSHVRCLDCEEFNSLAEKYDIAVESESITAIEMELDSWLELTGASEDKRKNIISDMKRDTTEKNITGFSPYIKNGKIFFDHRWYLLIGRKKV